MSLRTSKYLIRTVLILFTFQFFAPAFLEAPAEHTTHHFQHAFHKHESQPFSFASLFEKTEKENEEERDKSLAVEIFDIAIANLGRISASQEIPNLQTVSQHIQEPLLINLYCVYQI